jgi:hypothetical protein
VSKASILQTMTRRSRTLELARSGDEELGPLRMLPGVWSNLPGLPGRGWNMIALPFATGPNSPFNYRLLLNQYNETLRFTLVDKGVPNRGIEGAGAAAMQADQRVVTLDYEQSIAQIAADDRVANGANAANVPSSGEAGHPGLAIHHEPGLWLYLLNHAEESLDVARLSSIPHGNSVLALGSSQDVDGMPTIDFVDGLPIGVPRDLDSPYLAPYRHYRDQLFRGLFDPTDPVALLREANRNVAIRKTTVLEVDTTRPTGGLVNISFIERQADAASMNATFWIQELEETDAFGQPKLRLQYAQVVMLDFFPRRDGLPGRIAWPHVSINTLEKIPDARKPTAA